ncbi:hypothetical protein [Cognatilysobacter terrigena]|uniref:hypothetical protein n=1 Tax=Cognatilysobacter terrigena TaxID=2488749 RepID=UPI00105B27D7|nr:hypothetical protein [Lysobacter terrigena]
MTERCPAAGGPRISDAPSARARLLEDVADLLARQPATDLLGDLRQWLEGLVPQRRGLSALADRLLARDLVRAAHPDALDARLRVIDDRCAAHAAATERFLAHADSAIRDADQQLEMIGREREKASAAMADDVAAGPGALQRLDALHASWLATRAQVALARSTAEAVLDQYQHMRDLLMPLWRQHGAARAAAEHARAARGLAELQAAFAAGPTNLSLIDPHALESLDDRTHS